MSVKFGGVKERGYSEQFDAYYDPDTREWLETKCSDPNCEFCANRPDKAPEE